MLNLLTGYCIEPFIWFRLENVFCDRYLLQPIHFLLVNLLMSLFYIYLLLLLSYCITSNIFIFLCLVQLTFKALKHGISFLPISTQPTGHTTLLWRWINVTDVDSTSQQRHVPSGKGHFCCNFLFWMANII